MIKKQNTFFKSTIFFSTFISIFSSKCYANDRLDTDIQKILNEYLSSKEGKNELVTAASASVSLPSEKKIRNYSAGKMSNKKTAPSLSKSTLFQIGSIAKSFAAAIILQLEAEGVLDINETIGDWLPQYPKWKDVSIKRLLNMTSGIMDYMTAELRKKIPENLQKQWTDKELVDTVYALPGTTKGWNYSNTNYLLIGMIVEKATGHTFAQEIEKRLLNNKKLPNTFYLAGPTPQKILDRMPEGYFYNTRKDLFPLYGKNTANWNMSAASVAGAMVASTEDVVQWVRMLFGGDLFPSKQLKELEEIVSTTSALPIKEVSLTDPGGFGLGVEQIYFPNGGGAAWFYEGITLGFRSFYIYTPCNNITVSLLMNSSLFLAEKGITDNIFDIGKNIYDKILQEHPELTCKN